MNSNSSQETRYHLQICTVGIQFWNFSGQAFYSNIVSALTVILLYNFVPMLLGMVTVNATTFLIGQNSLVCLNDFLQNNDPEPRTGLADHKRRPNETRSKGHRIQNRALTESMKEVFYMFIAMGLKYFDYTMSGILLFIVTWRAKFVAKGDESLWWHICRIFNSVLLTIFCIFGVPLMSMFYL